MLIVENKHLKSLIEEKDARQRSAEAADRGTKKEAIFLIAFSLQRKVERLEEELESKDKLIASLQREGGLVSDEEVQQLRNKVTSLEAQLEFECRTHVEELQEKEARVAELEMQLLDAQRRSLSTPSDPQGLPQGSEESEQLQRKIEALTAELSKKEEELQKTKDQLSAREGEEKPSDEGRTHAEDAEAQQRERDLQQRMALRVQTELAGGPEEAEKIVEDLRREIRDKDEALRGMSKQLLEVSAEKDELAQEREALASQVQQLEEQMQKMSEKRVDLERTKVKLEGQLAEAMQELRAVRSEKAAVEERADMQKPLDAPDNLILPLPKGPQETDYDVRAASVLKDGIIRTLSSRIAHLQFALGEVKAEKEKLISQPASIALRQQLEEAKTELAEALTKYRDAVNERTELKVLKYYLNFNST
ncbi:hypothetical protein ACSSS7_002063 [Eimeria intestinalis]